METASSIINDALQEILVQANEQPIEAVDFQTSIRYLNRMMATFAAQGIALGYTKVTSAGDAITVADGAIEGMVFNLALRLAPSFDIPISVDLLLNARQGLNAMRKLSINILPTEHPCTLPIGSGNEGDNTFNNNHFYACPEDELLTEQQGSVLLESDT